MRSQIQNKVCSFVIRQTFTIPYTLAYGLVWCFLLRHGSHSHVISLTGLNSAFMRDSQHISSLVLLSFLHYGETKVRNENLTHYCRGRSFCDTVHIQYIPNKCYVSIRRKYLLENLVVVHLFKNISWISGYYSRKLYPEPIQTNLRCILTLRSRGSSVSIVTERRSGRLGPVTGSCEHGNEPTGSIKGREFPD
jgi:hypothetical protein